MKKLILMIVLLTGCAKPPRIAVTVQVSKTSSTAGKMTLTVKNEEDRPTTPISLEASVQPPHGAPIRVAHPAPFVLNRRETREIVAPFQSEAPALDAVIVLREGETGKLLPPASVKVLPPTSTPANPATAVPVTPPQLHR